MSVYIPPVRTFPDAEPSKAQALKPLEEAAEVLGAWQQVCDCFDDCDSCVHATYRGCVHIGDLVDECCDVIMATCNLLAALGVTDLSCAMDIASAGTREGADMVTNDERRRVVTALRSADMFSGLTFGCRWAELIFGEKPKCVEQRLRCSDCAIRALQYLADLIDPGSECDREALLALAEDVEESAAMATVMDASEGAKLLSGLLLDIARRIREACGVER